MGPAPPVPPAVGMPTSPSPIAVDKDTAFEMASGRRPFEVREAMAAIARPNAASSFFMGFLLLDMVRN